MAALQPADYVHLHNHTQFSLLDGLTQLGPMLDFAKASGMTAIAKTDHGTLSGTIEFYKEALARDIKPIIGIETYVAMRRHTDKDPAKDKNRFHLILLAMNNTGYKNIMRLSSIANLDGFYYFPRIDHELLEEYNEGVIVLSACMGGEIGNALKDGQYAKALDIASWYKSVFGDRYYLEIQDHGHPDNPLTNKEQEDINNQVLKLAAELDIQVVVTCDAHYLKHEDQDAHEILLCVGTGAYLSDQKRMSLKEFPLHIEQPTKIIERWGTQHPAVITTTKAIADRCNVEIELGKILIPKFPVPGGETEKSYLDILVYQGLAHRYGDVSEQEAQKLSIEQAKKTLPKNIADRAVYELGVIDSMGFNGYFLIIWDFIKWGKDNGIVFGPGRGSAAGSIIAYSLRITELDPMKYDLLFERFLNPDRISMPDIDIDIQDSRRDEVIQYCVEKYGTDRVANIVTFGRMAARAAVRDVARVLEVPYADADRLAKLIPPPVQGRHIPLEKSLVDSADLKAEYANNPTAKQVFDMAVRLEGTVRSHGIHAAGVVIAPTAIVDYAPLEKAQKGVVATQYPMGPIEELGLLKMDFLGLSNLTIIKNALRIIKKVYGDTIELGDIPLDDAKTYKLFQSGDTTGVFQLESAGMKRYLKELKPSSFDDIIAMVALYRPGPMQFIDSFIKRKHGEEEIVYLHPGMENSLKNTYGILVYQEQFMQISKEWCGFTGGQADTLRKAVGKKKIDLMRKVKVDFVEGAIKHSGASKEIAEKFWDQLEEFANYCFNKSHAACYGLIAYWTAYLKAHYPAAFMAALMTSDFDDTDRLAIEIAECKHMGIQVLPPDVNESFHEFSVVPHGKNEKPTVRFGMDAIKNVGHGAVENIIDSRTEHGQFKELADFIEHTNSRQVNKKVWESLIKSGAVDRFGNRGALLESIDTIVATAGKLSKEAAEGQVDLFGGDGGIEKVRPTIEIMSTGMYKEHEYLQWERELLGLYLSSHPLESFDAILTEKAVPFSKINASDDGKQAVIGGSIADVRQITTKNGQAMAFVQLEDIVGDQREVVVFPRTLEAHSDLIRKDAIVLIKAKVNGKDKSGALMPDAKFIADSFTEISIEEAKSYQPTGGEAGLKAALPRRQYLKSDTATKKSVDHVAPAESTKQLERLYIRLLAKYDDATLLKIKELIDQHPGDMETVLVVGEHKRPIRLSQKVNEDDALISALESIVGKEAVKVS